MGRSRYTIEKCHKIAINKNGKCLSIAYEGSKVEMSWECQEGHTWESNFANIMAGSWCPQCYYNSLCYKIEDCHNAARKRKGQCLSENYIGIHSNLKWKCSKNHHWTASLASVKNANSWCPICNKSLVERQVRKIFETIFQKPFPSKRLESLNNPDTGWSLELDGYNEELKLAFEYDGEQHYKPVEYWGGEKALQKNICRDTLKDELCVTAGIKLFRIPYTEKTNLEEYIKELLRDTI